MIYPNPTAGIIHINTEYEIENYQLFDFNGALLEFVNKIEIDLRDKNAGVYILQLKLKNGGTIKKKIIKKNGE